MTQNEEHIPAEEYSKFSRISLVILSMLLIFAGPTYVPYLMEKASINAIAGMAVGILLFIVGMALMLFLVRKKIITA